MHGDLKLNNAIRINDSIKLIDMDAAGNIDNGDFAAAKFSSACLPPELFYDLKSDNEVKSYEDFWKNVERRKIEAVDKSSMKSALKQSSIEAIKKSSKEV